jgi:hypothetical protein
MQAKTIKAVLMAVVLLAMSVVPALAGAVGGPKYGRYRVGAHSSRTFTVSFYGGETGRVAVSGDGDTDLDLYVYDALGNLIAADEDETDDCVVSWVPRWTGSFTIKVVNRGDVYNDFVIATN